MPSTAAGKYLPNRLLFFFHRTLEESIGRTAVNLVWQSGGPRKACLPSVADDLEKAVEFACFSALCASIERIYGELGARTILYRCGRAALSGTLHSTAAIVGLDGPRRYTQFGSERIAEGLRSVTRLMGMLSDMDCDVEITSQGFQFHVSACPECFGRTSGGKICHSVGGMLRGALDWFGFDPELPVSETECIACGAHGCDFSFAGIF